MPLLVLLLCLVLGTSLFFDKPAKSHWRPEYAQQYTPEEQLWFNQQKVPGTTNRCCSIADGVAAQEDLREGKYWVRFTANRTTADYENNTNRTEEVDSDWMLVPDNVIIVEPNKMQRPVVWYFFDGAMKLQIKCFIPGAKM